MTAANAMSAAASPSDGVLDWATILARHDRWLRAVVLARLGERQAIDEVMQEIFLAAIQKTATLADPSKVAAWLYRIAVAHDAHPPPQGGTTSPLRDSLCRGPRQH